MRSEILLECDLRSHGGDFGESALTFGWTEGDATDVDLEDYY
jgi:hypothetical protein